MSIPRREFVTLLAGAAAVAWPLAARAQQPGARARALLARILEMEASGTANAIAQFLNEIVSQIGWTTQLPWTAGNMPQRRFDALRLLRQVVPIPEVAFLDGSGIEQLKVSRLAMDVTANKTDLSQDPKFAEAVAHRVYFGPVYWFAQAPHMILSVAGARREAGVTAATVGLDLVLGLVQRSDHGVVYLLDAQGRVIAHSAMLTPPAAGERGPYHVDPTIFQRDFSALAQVQAARAAGSGSTQAQTARDMDGREVLSASASVAGPGWHVFVELPLAEADTAVP